MRVRPKELRITVAAEPQAPRPIVLRFAGLAFTARPAEARALALALADAIEAAGRGDRFGPRSVGDDGEVEQ